MNFTLHFMNFVVKLKDMEIQRKKPDMYAWLSRVALLYIGAKLFLQLPKENV